MARTPGPGPKYMVPSTIGFENANPVFKTSPAYSLGTRFPASKLSRTPAPKYFIGKYTRNGATFSPEAPFSYRSPMGKKFVTPAPNKYKPELFPDVFHKNPPAYTLGFRPVPRKKKTFIPGPNKYNIPRTIGEHIPDLPAAPSHSMAFKDRRKLKWLSPGPAKYQLPELSAYKKNPPSAFFTSKTQQKIARGPGPKYHPQYNLKTNAPEYTFGVKHSFFKTMVRTPYDTGDFFAL